MRLPKHTRMIAAGVALATAAGATLPLRYGLTLPGWAVPIAAAAIVLLSWALFARQPKTTPPVPKGVDYSTLPAYGTRRWARMMYKNGNCTMEELQSWFAANPNAPED